MSKLLSFDTTANEEKLVTNAMVDIAPVTIVDNQNGVTPVFGTHIHPTMELDGCDPSVVSSLSVDKPAFSLIHSGATIDIASSIYVGNAPTEGTNNYGIYVNAASNKINGDLEVNSFKIDGEDLPKSSVVLLNSLSTLTATADDLNVLTGTTATAAEINYLTGVTDPIQGQIDLRLTETLADTLYMRKSGTVAALESGTTIGNLTFNNGEIFDSSGIIGFKNNDLNVIKDIGAVKLDLSDTLTVGGNSEMTGSLSVASSITGSSIESDGTLSVAGDSTLTGSVTAGSLVTGNISSSGGTVSFGSENISTTGILTSGDLSVTGNSTIAGNTSITGTTDLSNTLTINKANANYTPSVNGLIVNTGTGNNYTDSLTAIGQTADSVNLYSFNPASLTAENDNVTTTNASTVYIAGPPTKGNKMTLTNAKSKWVKEGMSHFGGKVIVDDETSINNTLSVSGTISSDSTVTAASGSKLGNLTFSDGLITDSGNAISFGNNSITTAGLASAGSLNVNGTTTTGQTNLSDSLNVTGNIVGLAGLTVGGVANMNNGANVTGNIVSDGLTVNGNAQFNSTINATSGSTIGNLTFTSGSITDSSKAIGFSDNSLSTTGTVSTGNLSVTGTAVVTSTVTAASGSKLGDVTIADGSITSDTATINMGTNNVETSGTIKGATGSSFGNIVVANNSITSDGNGIDFGDENLSTDGTLESGNLTVTGNLVVTGDTTAIDSQNMSVTDPIMVLAKDTVGDAALDTGILIERGDSINVGMIWDEIDNKFTFISTQAAGSESGNIVPEAYVPVKMGPLESSGQSTLGDVTLNSLICNTTLNVAGSVTFGNVTINGDNITSSTNEVDFADNAIKTTGTITSASGTEIGDITIADGSITSDSATLSMGANNISTTGDIIGKKAILTSTLQSASGSKIGDVTIADGSITK